MSHSSGWTKTPSLGPSPSKSVRQRASLHLPNAKPVELSGPALPGSASHRSELLERPIAECLLALAGEGCVNCIGETWSVRDAMQNPFGQKCFDRSRSKIAGAADGHHVA